MNDPVAQMSDTVVRRAGQRLDRMAGGQGYRRRLCIVGDSAHRPDIHVARQGIAGPVQATLPRIAGSSLGAALPVVRSRGPISATSPLGRLVQHTELIDGTAAGLDLSGR